jgi:hypothetical protein
MKSLHPIDVSSAAVLVKETEKGLASALESASGFGRRQAAAGRRRKAGRK